jgi:hypothetical protein
VRRRSAQVGALVLGLLRTLAAALDSYDDGEDQEDVLAATSELVSTFVELHVPRISQRPDFPVRGAARNMDLNLPGSRRRRRRDAVDAAVGESTRLGREMASSHAGRRVTWTVSSCVVLESSQSKNFETELTTVGHTCKLLG